MNIRHYLPKFIAVAAVALLAATSSCFGYVLSVPYHAQEKNNWCWCASAQMVLEFYGHTYTQTEIAQWAVGGQDIANYLYGSTDANMHGDDEILAHYGDIESTGLAYAISYSTLSGEMEHTRPVIIRWGWDSEGGHILVIRGADSEDEVYLNDPWYGQSINTYSWVCRGSSHTWTHTLQLNESHVDDNYTKYLYYYDLYTRYYNYYQSTGNTLALAYGYYYYAYAIYYYKLYTNGSTDLAKAYYNLYMANAYYYYYAYYGYSHAAAQAYYYYMAYTYYYYAYYIYAYYINAGNSSYANYYFNYYMTYAVYYYNLSQR